MNKSQRLELMVMRAKVRARKSWTQHLEDWFGEPDKITEKPKRINDGSNPSTDRQPTNPTQF